MKPKTKTGADPSAETLARRVVFDTNALFRFPVRVLILHLSQTGGIKPLWSARTVEELRGVLASRGRPDAEAFLKQFSNSTVAVAPGAAVELKGFRDPGDLHVVSAAIDACALVIVTENARDFPAKLLRPLGIERQSADAFFAERLTLHPSGLEGDELRRAGLPRTAKRLSLIAADRG